MKGYCLTALLIISAFGFLAMYFAAKSSEAQRLDEIEHRQIELYDYLGIPLE